MLRPNRVVQAVLVLILVGLDMATKVWAQTADITTNGPTEVLPFLSLVLAYNPGLTFDGLLSLSQHPVLSALLSSSIIAALAVWMNLRRVIAGKETGNIAPVLKDREATDESSSEASHQARDRLVIENETADASRSA